MNANSWLNTVQFLSLAFVALCLGPALAHLLALPNKIELARDDYFTVQQIYRGWALLGIVIVGALVSTLALAWMTRRQPPAFYWVLTSLVCLVLAQALFWIFTYPANVATNNWTAVPENWQALRVRWEYSHAVGAILTLAALAALVLALMARTRPSA
jgi:hypothetical protein